MLVETLASNKEMLETQIRKTIKAIEKITVQFTNVPAEYAVYWEIRKGLFPSVKAVRKTGTTVIIEDVAFPLHRLAEATHDLQSLFRKYDYNEALVFGHALDGNLHFVFTQDFSSSEEIMHYERFMQEVGNLVVLKYDGSLKAEHGTGRNMAPFVEFEWGTEAFELMKQIKHIFDPKNLLNPGVILNNDVKAHLKNLKPLPSANEQVDKCIECGFCEPSCVSAELTLSPRQRITVFTASMPRGAKIIRANNNEVSDTPKKVVYFPSCTNRSMGISKGYDSEVQLTEKMQQLVRKAGYEVIFPEKMNDLCYRMAFSSKGFKEAGLEKSKELENALWIASKEGAYPVVCDMSPCFYTMKENMEPNLKLYEPVGFILEYLISNLEITPIAETISVFPVCSMKKMGLENQLARLAEMCAAKVVVPETNCCGFAGDRGFSCPELNAHGFRDLKNQLPGSIKKGYSTNRTCEIGLTENSGISHQSIVYLVDKVSKVKQT